MRSDAGAFKRALGQLLTSLLLDQVGLVLQKLIKLSVEGINVALNELDVLRVPGFTCQFPPPAPVPEEFSVVYNVLLRPLYLDRQAGTAGEATRTQSKS